MIINQSVVLTGTNISNPLCSTCVYQCYTILARQTSRNIVLLDQLFSLHPSSLSRFGQFSFSSRIQEEQPPPGHRAENIALAGHAFSIFDPARKRAARVYISLGYKTFAGSHRTSAFSANRPCGLTSLFSARAPK